MHFILGKLSMCGGKRHTSKRYLSLLGLLRTSTVHPEITPVTKLFDTTLKYRIMENLVGKDLSILTQNHHFHMGSCIHCLFWQTSINNQAAVPVVRNQWHQYHCILHAVPKTNLDFVLDVMLYCLLIGSLSHSLLL